MKISDIKESILDKPEDKNDPYALHDVTKGGPNIDKMTDQREIAEYILKTSPIVAKRSAKGEHMYRGLLRARAPVIHTSVRTNRLPVEMELDRHRALDELFAEMKIKTTRSNSIFVTSSDRIASSWGVPYIVFPKEPWSGLLFHDNEHDYSFHVVRFAAKKWLEGDKTEAINRIRFLGPEEFKHSDPTLRRFYKRGFYEMLVRTHDYIALKCDSPMTEEILKELQDLVK